MLQVGPLYLDIAEAPVDADSFYSLKYQIYFQITPRKPVLSKTRTKKGRFIMPKVLAISAGRCRPLALCPQTLAATGQRFHVYLFHAPGHAAPLLNFMLQKCQSGGCHSVLLSEKLSNESNAGSDHF